MDALQTDHCIHIVELLYFLAGPPLPQTTAVSITFVFNMTLAFPPGRVHQTKESLTLIASRPGMRLLGKYTGKDGEVCAGTLTGSNLSLNSLFDEGIRKYPARR